MAEEQANQEQPQDSLQNMSKDEQIGFHKGSLSTLGKEKMEFSRILQIVDQLIQLHMAELKKLGVDLEQELAKPVTKPKDKIPIEDIL